MISMNGINKKFSRRHIFLGRLNSNCTETMIRTGVVMVEPCTPPARNYKGRLKIEKLSPSFL